MHVQRFWSKVNKTDTCWLWTRSTTVAGYGRFKTTGNRYVLAHRWSYENTWGPIPSGLVIDHLCRTPGCVRPDHLEAVTHGENVRRGVRTSPRSSRAPKSGRPRNPDGSFVSCPQGHPYAGDNLYVSPRGFRMCRRCNADRQAWRKGV